MKNTIKCPVPRGDVECGREEILARKQGLGRRPGSDYQVVHHECGLHKFHIEFPGGGWVPCGCSSDQTVTA